MLKLQAVRSTPEAQLLLAKYPSRGETFLKKGHSGVKTHAKLWFEHFPGPKSAVFTQENLPPK